MQTKLREVCKKTARCMYKKPRGMYKLRGMQKKLREVCR